MKRRDFLKKSTAAAVGLAGSQKLLQSSTAGKKDLPGSIQVPSAPSARTTPVSDGEASVSRLGGTQESEFLPKPPLFAASLQPARQKIVPMPLNERIRRGVVPKRGLCSIAPGKSTREGFISGNGMMRVEVAGDPFSEQILFHHESLLVPWKRPFEAPKVASILPELRKLLLAGKYREGVDMAFRAMADAGLPVNVYPHPTIAAFMMHLELPEAGAAEDYLRTVDFESGEVRVLWKDQRGEWLRQLFVSGPDNVVAQLLTPPPGQSVNARIVLLNPPVRRGVTFEEVSGPITFEQDGNEQRLIFTGRFDPAVNNNGYAAVTRVIRTGGSARLEEGKLVVENAQSVTLLTRIEWYSDFNPDKVEALVQAVDEIKLDYPAVLARNRQRQSSIFDRVSVDFGGSSQQAMASEELLIDQRTRPGYSPALLEKIFDMGRYWHMHSSGHYPPMVAEVNANINLQISGGMMGNLPEAMASYFDWIESVLPDCRKNAQNIFGARGAVYPVLPDKGIGVSFHYAVTVNGGIWPHPYWISAGGWVYSPFWDYYLVTGDLEFLRRRVVPGLKELALFYEDFLKVTDERGNYVFVPSFSPENTPTGAEPLPLPAWPETPSFGPYMSPPTTLVVNANMDIMVCREVLAHLIEASEILDTDLDNVPKWKAMLEKLPPYLLDPDGMLKEWAWPSLQDNLNHRHVSHLYGVWPGDEIDPDRTPQLAKAALLADRKRAPETLAAHGLCHRALAGARLKDNYLVDYELKQLLEQGYVGPTLLTSHNPYTPPMPDAQGGIPTIMMEMLVYSRPGVIELLPALPASLEKGAIQGMLARTFVKIDRLAWDMPARSADVSLTSLRKQDITLIVRHGIETITAPSGVLARTPQPDATTCDLHLPEGKPVRLHLTLGRHKPLDWVAQVAPS